MSGIYRGPNGSATADALNIDGDKGDLTISNSGLEWTINPDVVTTTKLGGDITPAGKALLDDADASAQRVTLGLGDASTANIGTDVLAFDSNLQGFIDTFTLPTTDATNGFVLTTNGAGTLSLSAPGGIPDGDKGDITVSSGGTVWTVDTDAITTTKILDDNVTYAKIQNVSATDKLLGRSSAGAGNIEEITCTSAGRNLLDDVDASAQRNTLGLGSIATLNSIANANITSNTIALDKLARVGTAGQVLTSNGVGSDASYQSIPLATSAEIKTAIVTNKSITPDQLLLSQGFTAYFQSANQTLTAGGALTIAHGLGRKPILIQLYLVSIIAEGGYTIGDEVYYSNNHSNSSVDNLGASVVPDATNLNVRIGANSSFATILNKSTGALLNINNANWRLIIRAWA